MTEENKKDEIPAELPIVQYDIADIFNFQSPSICPKCHWRGLIETRDQLLPDDFFCPECLKNKEEINLLTDSRWEAKSRIVPVKSGIETDQFIPLVGAELEKLPGSDKTMHFSGSYAFCSLFSEHFDKKAITPSSICILKAILDSFRVGLEKEYKDKSLDFSTVSPAFDKMAESLLLIYSEYKKNGLDEARYEGDLLADLAGIGTYVVNQSLRNLQLLLLEDENEN